LYQPSPEVGQTFVNQPSDPVSLQERDELGHQTDATPADNEADSSDAEIAYGLARGRACAWTALHDAYSIRVWQYVARMIGPDAAAVADIVQETLLAAAESARTFDESKGSLWQWLSGIAHHRVAGHWQAQKRTQTVLKRLQERQSPIPHISFERSNDSTTAPDARLLQQELADVVRLVLATLPADYAGLLTAKYVDELSLVEIQQQTQSSSDAVRSKLLRARKEFRKVYERITQAADEPPG
jgi:RNA polymerase sigma-70 factor (ECF subfamily)